MDMLDGMFSFVLLDTRDKSFIAARDAIGITPLYMGWGLDGRNFFILLYFFFCFLWDWYVHVISIMQFGIVIAIPFFC